jgi:uncharacterized protein DUF3592
LKTIPEWLASGILILVGFFMLLVALADYRTLRDARRLSTEGTRTDGLIMEIRRSQRRANDDFSYEFSAFGRTYGKHRVEVGGANLGELAAGQRIPVWYEAANPQLSITAPERARLEELPSRIFFPLLGLALLAFGIVRSARHSWR